MKPADDESAATGHCRAQGGGEWCAALVLLLYAGFFIVHCRLDVAPPTWDQAYLLQYPVMVRAAWEHEGLLAAIRTFWSTRFMKPPLSMLGTMVPLFLFGTDGVSYRLDNLVVACVAVLILGRFLGRYLPRPWAATLALSILVSPYALGLARTEMAELYLWASLIAWLACVLPEDPLRTRRRSLALGVASAAGMLAKLSFPLFVIGPSVWALVRTLREGHRAQDLGRRLSNLRLSLMTALVIFVPLAAYNWKRMWRHFRVQYGWVGEEYRAGNPLSLGYAVTYFRALAEWIGPVWLVLAVVVVLALAARRVTANPSHNDSGDASAAPWVPLVALFAINLTYCYFVHPVPEPRFVIGSFLALQLLVALGVGALLAASSSCAPLLARAMLIVPLIMLLASSHFPSGGAVLPWAVPLLGASARVVPPPRRIPDLRDAILDRLPACAAPCTVGVAGDHPHLNNENLQLRAYERGMLPVFRQIAYAAPDVSVPDRVRKLGPIVAWVVIVPASDGSGTSWASRYAASILTLLQDGHDQYRRVAWDGDLGDGTAVRLYGD